MAAWAMFLGMATLVNVTMTGALVSLVGNIPDSSFLIILSRYLGKRMPPGGVLHPLEATSRLERLRGRVLVAAAVIAAAGAAFSLWALLEGWGAVAMLAITFLLAAANLAFLSTPLALWIRRAGRMGDGAVEEAKRKARPGQPEQAAGESGTDTAGGGPRHDPDAGMGGG
jgi:hypothetical protein